MRQEGAVEQGEAGCPERCGTALDHTSSVVERSKGHFIQRGLEVPPHLDKWGDFRKGWEAFWLWGCHKQSLEAAVCLDSLGGGTRTLMIGCKTGDVHRQMVSAFVDR